MSDHKHQDQLQPLFKQMSSVHTEIAFRVHILRCLCNQLRDKLTLLIEFISLRSGGTNQQDEVAFYKYKNDIYNGLVERNARIKTERGKYTKDYNSRKKSLAK